MSCTTPSYVSFTLLALGDLYGKLQLPLSARQYALAAAKAARASDADEVAGLVPHALFMASEHDYRAGSFASALQALQVAVSAQQATLRALCGDRRFATIVALLRRRGWRD